MGRPKGSIGTPSYRLHKATGQAVVTIDGKDRYLGKYESLESQQKYNKLLGEWLSNGRTLDPLLSKTRAGTLTITELCALYWKHLTAEFPRRENGREFDRVAKARIAIRCLRNACADAAVADFGPLALKTVRDRLIRSKVNHYNRWKQTSYEVDRLLSRKTINAYVEAIIRVFQWGTENELVSSLTYQSLAAIAPLQQGRPNVRETEKIKPVPESDIEAVRVYLPPMIADIMDLQLLTGARSGEICPMRVSEIDMSRDVWRYRPAHHKTSHKGIERIIPIGPKAQDIIRRYLTTNISTPLFDIRKSREQVKRLRNFGKSERSLALRSASEERQRRRKGKPEFRYCETLHPGTYRKAIQDAIDKCNRDRAANSLPPIGRWHPHQLRHNSATRLRAAGGLEVAKTVLGHRSTDTTLIYAERDLAAAEQVIAQVG